MSKQAIEIMIRKCDNHIESFRSTIQFYENMPVLSAALKVYYTRLKTTLAIKQRLENYYNRL